MKHIEYEGKQEMRYKNLEGSWIVSLLLMMLLLISGLGYGQHHQERMRERERKHGRDGGKISVVASLPCYASIVEYIGGDFITVDNIASGNQDPHFVQPKPSYARMLSKADMFITTGLDLELWVPTIIDKSRNRRVFEGAVGYVSVATDVSLLERTIVNPDRSMGDVHVYGNPHIHTSPLNAKMIAENIVIGLKKVSPENSAAYDANYGDFINRIDRSMFGDELIELFGGELLTKMVMSGTLIDFLQTKEYGGEKLISKLGGWVKEGMPFRGMKVICYHKNWNYFTRDFGLEIVDYIEPKPGIPPTAKHVKEVIEEIENQGIQVMMVAGYFEKNSPKMIAERTGIKDIFLPLDVAGEPGVNTYFELIDCWIDRLNEAFK